MTNLELINHRGDPWLLSPVDRQKQFILRLHAQAMPCPNCAHHLNVFEALGVEPDDYDATSATNDHGMHCTSCKRELVHVVPLFAHPNPWRWELVPIKVEG